MNKQKTLIFSLSAMLFLTASFLVYSWSEPTTTMPGSYSIPLNTSGTAQTKSGDLSATSFIDTNNPSYYLNPSGNCKIAGGMTSDLTIENIDSSDAKTLVTREYLDFALSQLGQETITSTANTLYIDGTNPTCPDNMIPLFHHWLPRTCYFSGWSSIYLTTLYGCCTTDTQWSDVTKPPYCSVTNGGKTSPCSSGYGNFGSSPYYCYNNTWDAVICAQSTTYDGTPFLAYYIHTSQQCTNQGGTVVTADDGKLICKMTGSSCPSSWSRYQNYMKTESCTATHSKTTATCSTAGHDFSGAGTSTAVLGGCYNVAMSEFTKTCCGFECCNNFDYCYSSTYSSCTTPITEIGCY